MVQVIIGGASIDWDATGSMLSGMGAWGAIAALVWATFKGRQTVKDIRAQRQSEKAIEAAERTLTAAYGARSAIEGVRSNLMEVHEFERAAEVLKEQGRNFDDVDDQMKRRLYAAQAFYNRLNAVREEFNAVWDVMPIALAYFGEDVLEQLKTLVHQRRIIQVTADEHAEDDGSDDARTKEIRATLYRSHDSRRANDPVAQKVEGAIRELEARLLPILRSDATDTTLGATK